jgi:hypothetical protein
LSVSIAFDPKDLPHRRFAQVSQAQYADTSMARHVLHQHRGTAQRSALMSQQCATWTTMLRRTLQGPRMVRDVFRLAKENAPAIIFIDEVDAIATARFDAQTGLHIFATLCS